MDSDNYFSSVLRECCSRSRRKSQHRGAGLPKCKLALQPIGSQAGSWECVGARHGLPLDSWAIDEVCKSLTKRLYFYIRSTGQGSSTEYSTPFTPLLLYHSYKSMRM
jgi:hypothetical protein